MNNILYTPKTDKRKHVVFTSAKINTSIYFYEENDGTFSVSLEKEGRVISFLSFTQTFAAKRMCYWLSGKVIMKNFDISTSEFIDGSYEMGVEKWIS